MNEFLEQFLIEAREIVEQATADLLSLEERPDDGERLDGAFRGFHTLKGGAAIVEFAAMGRVLHAAEDLLSAVRAGDHPVTADLISDCLSCLDQVVLWLDQIEAVDDLPEVPQPLVEAMVARFAPAAPRPASTVDPAPDDWSGRLLAAHPDVRTQARLALVYTPAPDCFFRGEDPLALIAKLPGLLAADLAAREPWPPLEEIDPFACNLVIGALTEGGIDEARAILRGASDQVRFRVLDGPAPPDGGPALSPDAVAILEEQLGMVAAAETEGLAGRLGSAGETAARVLRHAGRSDHAMTIQAAVAVGQAAGSVDLFAATLRALLDGTPVPGEQGKAQAATAPAAPREAAARALRVEVERVDALVRLAGEMTVLKNALGHAAQLARERADPEQLAQTLKAQHVQLDRLVGELQRSVLGIRVLQLRHVFQRFPKLVREMAAGLGKSVRLTTEGESTEADKAIVEALFEPLMHVVRNALDHGIEGEAERAAAGKPPVASLRLRAAREGDRVVVEVADDGRGVDTARVAGIALERGLATADELAAMGEPDLVELIFAPGFSTAATVTDISGRGVGMDAVRAAVAQMRGAVTVESLRGQGSRVIFTLPFTVMMSRVMTVEAAGQVFGVPFETVVETARIPRERISSLGAAKAFVLRGRTVPVAGLAETLGLATREPGPDANVLVVTVDGQLGAIEVDRFGEQIDVMLKPMEGLLTGARGVAGTTLLGDGRVLIVLDLKALVG